MVLANLYFKDIGSTQAATFSPNTVFHSLRYSQQSLRHVYFLQFTLISVRPPLKPLQLNIRLRGQPNIRPAEDSAEY